MKNIIISENKVVVKLFNILNRKSWIYQPVKYNYNTDLLISAKMQCRIDDLPDELLEYILSLIPPYKDLQECKLVSKRWFRATKSMYYN